MTLDFDPGRKKLSLFTGLDIKKGILWRPKDPSLRFVCLEGVPRSNSALQTLLSLPKPKMLQHQNYKQKKTWQGDKWMVVLTWQKTHTLYSHCKKKKYGQQTPSGSTHSCWVTLIQITHPSLNYTTVKDILSRCTICAQVNLRGGKNPLENIGK